MKQISSPLLYDDDGVKRVTTTTTETTMTKRKKRVSSGTAHSNEPVRHPLRRPPHEAQSAAEAAGKQAKGPGSLGAASRTCPNEPPHKSLADDPKAMDLALIQPSSCFIERVFSMLRACMDSRQERALSDRIAAAVLLKYNRGQVSK